MIALILVGLIAAQEPDVDALLKQLEDESIEVREKAAAALIEAGDKAVPKLKARAASAEGGLRVMCDRILEQIAVPKELRQAIPPLRKVTMAAAERSVKAIFEDIQAQTGVTINMESVVDSTASVDLKDATPFEAIAAICKAARCGYYVESGNPNQPGMRAPGPQKPMIRILPGSYSDAPRAFARHYVVEVTNLSLTRSNNFQSQSSQGALQFRLNWLPGMRPDQAQIDIESVTDDKGRSLLNPGQREIRRSGSHRFGGWNTGSVDQHVSILHPDGDVKSIASVKGTAVLKYVVGEKLVSFENPDKAVGEKREAGARSLELLDWKQGDDFLSVKLKLSGAEKADAWDYQRLEPRHIRFKTEDGSTPVAQGWGSSGGGDGSYTANLSFGQVKSKVISVDVVIETRHQEDKFEFELKDIPLPR